MINNVSNNHIDFDLYGIVGIRLIDPSDKDVKYVSRFLSRFKADLSKEPDITIRFKKKWELGDVTYLGLNDAAFNENGFYILSSGRAPLKVKIPFEQIGEKCEIVCEQGIIGIPLLHYIINLTFLKKKYLPMHASAFSYDNQGALIIGWSKGGKTEALFSFIKHGAEFIGDETVIVSPDGKKMFGIPVPVSIWEWQFSEIPELMPPLSAQKKILFKGVHFVERVNRFYSKGRLKKNAVVKLIGEALPTLRKQLNIRVNPEEIFNGKVRWSQVNLNKLVIIMSHNKDDITLDKCNTNKIADRMITSNLYELDSFNNYYNIFKFAFPGVKNDFLENLDKIYNKILPNAISGIESYKVLHPYPVSFEKLYTVMKPIFHKNNNN
ncbi:MAG: hypothetical protein WBH40_01110 [Ignavibacteriaceae bacterium]